MNRARSPLPVRFNFARHILSLNAGRKQRLAYRDDHRDLSYGELDERVRRFAAGLQHQGIQPEQRILLVMQDSIDLPVAFLGALFPVWCQYPSIRFCQPRTTRTCSSTAMQS